MFNDTITDIFFDLDHALWDFKKNMALAFQKILKENQVDVVLEDFLTVYIPISQNYWKLYEKGKISKVQMRFERLKQTFDSMGMGISDTLISVLDWDYIEYHPSLPSLLPYAKEILRYLFPKYKLHIITNGFKDIQEKKLIGSHIIQYFDQIITSEVAGVNKPHRHIFQLALHKAQVAPKNALMIGDHAEIDIIGAKAVGMHTLHFNNNGQPKHELCPILGCLSELKIML